MKKYLMLIFALICINFAKGQSDNRLDGEFIYQTLLDLYHNSAQADNDAYYTKFGFDLATSFQLPNGAVEHIALDNFLHPARAFSVATHAWGNNFVATEESAYSTDDRKEYKSLLNYVTSLGYKVTSSGSGDDKETDVMQMNNLMITFVKDNRPGDNDINAYLFGTRHYRFKVIYKIKGN